MKNKIGIAIASIALILLQMTVLGYLKINDIKPDFMVIFIVFLSLFAKSSDLFFGGILCGILQDMTLSKTIGLYFIVNLIFCCILSKIKNNSRRESLVTCIIGSLVAFLIYNIIGLVVCAFPTSFRELIYVLKNYVLVGAAYNTVCASIVFIMLKIKDSMGENYVK